MDEVDRTCPTVAGRRFRQRGCPPEVRVPRSQRLEFVTIKQVGGGARTIEIADFAGGALAKLLMDHRTQRCHANTTPDKDHLALAGLNMEVTIWPGHSDRIARLQ